MKGRCCFCKVEDEVVERGFAFSATASSANKPQFAVQAKLAREALWEDQNATLCRYCFDRFMQAF